MLSKMVETKYFLINKKCGSIGGHNYGSVKVAEEAIDLCNIPNEDAEVFVLPMNYTNKIDWSKCAPPKHK